jgi:hypothetical protein
MKSSSRCLTISGCPASNSDQAAACHHVTVDVAWQQFVKDEQQR